MTPMTFVLIGFFVLFMLFSTVVLLMRKAKYGSMFYSLSQTMLGGSPIADKNGTGDLAELISYDTNPHTNLIALKLNFPEKMSTIQTGFIFQPEDFNINPLMFPWEHHNGVIICFWDFERKQNFADVTVKNLTHQLQIYRQHTGILQRTSRAISESIEMRNVPEAKVASDIGMAQGLKVIKDIVTETNVENVTPQGDEDDDMFEK